MNEAIERDGFGWALFREAIRHGVRGGVAVAKLVSVEPARRPGAASQRQRVAAVFADLRTSRKGVTLDIPVREAIEQGRD